jgi:adenine-specific DNA-methyltransferase
VLKLLQKAYYGKIKMIYIDPPYNTGNEFIYPDNYSESLETYLAYAGLVDGKGKKFSTNTKAEGRFHTKWLNMMYPRLYLARNLLREDGVIFISIDDNEVENLRRMCDEIFGEENLIECFVWKKSYGGPKEKYAVTQHEYVLMFAKSKTELNPFLLEYDPLKIDRYYKHKDENFQIRGPYRLKPLEATKSMDSRPNLFYGIPSPSGQEIFPKRQWLWSKERVLKAIERNELQITEESVSYKQYLKDDEGTQRGEKPFSVIDGIYTQRGTDDIRKLFDDNVVIQFPKPVDLVSKFIEIAFSGHEGGIVLDFFAGSGTLGEAIQRKNSNKVAYILVQLPEPCDGGSVAFKFGIKTVSGLCKERLRRSSRKISNELSQQLDLKEKSEMDLGFRAFKLERSNFKIWRNLSKDVPDLELIQQMELSIDHIDPGASQEDILYELLLKAGIKPTETIVTVELAGHKIFSVADSALLVHLENTIDKELIDAVLERKPEQFICLDRAFHGNDQLKANAVKTFEAYNQSLKNEDTPIVFRTV